MLAAEKRAADIVTKFVIKEEKCQKSRPSPKIVVLENEVTADGQKEMSKLQLAAKKKTKKKDSKSNSAPKEVDTTKAKARKSKYKQKRKLNFEKYYGNVKKKFGWGVDPDKLTKEQLDERARLKTKSFKKNTCPLCKSRFRMRSRMKEHVKKQTCSCKYCGLIYQSAFQRSDHRWTCDMRLRSENIKRENLLSNGNTIISPLWSRPPVFSNHSNPPEIVMPIQPSTLALGVIPQSLQSESNFALPTLTLDFWPSRIKQPLCPVENDKFNRRPRLDKASEPSFGSENVAKPPPNTLDKEIKSLLVTDKLDIIMDF